MNCEVNVIVFLQIVLLWALLCFSAINKSAILTCDLWPFFWTIVMETPSDGGDVRVPQISTYTTEHSRWCIYTMYNRNLIYILRLFFLFTGNMRLYLHVFINIFLKELWRISNQCYNREKRLLIYRNILYTSKFRSIKPTRMK